MSTHTVLPFPIRHTSALSLTDQPSPTRAVANPHDVFFAWLVHLPTDADLVSRAKQELERLTTQPVQLPEIRLLQSLFQQLIDQKTSLDQVQSARGAAKGSRRR